MGYFAPKQGICLWNMSSKALLHNGLGAGIVQEITCTQFQGNFSFLFSILVLCYWVISASFCMQKHENIPKSPRTCKWIIPLPRLSLFGLLIQNTIARVA